MIEVGQQMGADLRAPISWHEQLKAVGFTDIHVKWFNWPIGPWAKHEKNKILGRLVYKDFYEGLSSVGPIFMKVLGWSAQEMEGLVAQIKNEFEEQKVHLYQQVCFCYARKPTKI
jgi:hypothetical protein